VGVDPVLRQTIWDYMVELTKFGRTTIIVTTHYIDETRQVCDLFVSSESKGFLCICSVNRHT
jgi:ABC-type multidrug transport system ATPase subunit